MKMTYFVLITYVVSAFILTSWVSTLIVMENCKDITRKAIPHVSKSQLLDTLHGESYLNRLTCPYLHLKLVSPAVGPAVTFNGPLGTVVEKERCDEFFDLSSRKGEQLIFDLSCTKPWHTAFYHRLMDCFVPSLCALSHALTQRGTAPVTIVVPPYLMEVYKYFLSDIVGNLTLLEYQEENWQSQAVGIPRKMFSFCLMLPVGPTTILYPDWEIPKEKQGRYLENFRQLIGSNLDKRSSSSHENYITMINRNLTRKHTRCFRDAERILKSFSERFNMPGRMYYGNESFGDTVRMFYHSKVVIGFHGAGFANTIFSRPGTIVLEYTTFHDMEGKHLWRSNSNISMVHSGLTWLIHTLDIDHMVPDLNRMTNRTDVDRFIKNVKSIDVTGSDLFNSIERVNRELRTE